MKNTLVVNIFGGPGGGKSTVMADIFARLKWKNIDCEMAPEYAKGKVWEESFNCLDDQFYISAKQYHNIFILNKKVDIVITDSPILLGIYYGKNESQEFYNLLIKKYNEFNNLNIFLKRIKPFHQNGRIQNEKESIEIDNVLKEILDYNKIPYTELFSSDTGIDNMIDLIIHHLKLINNEYNRIN